MDAIDKDNELRMWCAVRRDIHIPKPKFGAQAGHAYVTAILEAQKQAPELVDAYMAADQPKIVVWAKNADELRKVHLACMEAGLPCAIITDAGRTVFPEPTLTVMGVGPCRRGDLPKAMQRLQLMREEAQSAD